MSSNFSKKIRDDLSDNMKVNYLTSAGTFTSKRATKGYAALSRERVTDDIMVPLSKAAIRFSATEFSVVMSCATNFIQISKIIERAHITACAARYFRDVIFRTLHRVNYNTKKGCEAIPAGEFSIKVGADVCLFVATPRCFALVKEDSMDVLRVAFYYGPVYTFTLPVFEETPALKWTDDGRYLTFLPHGVIFDLAKLERIERMPDGNEKDLLFGDAHPSFFLSACAIGTVFFDEGPTYETPLFVSQANIKPLTRDIISDPKMNRAMGWDLSVKKSRV